MKQITAVWSFLKGKKTYIVTLGGCIYGWGIAQGLWHHSVIVDTLLGGAWSASVRHAIATTNGTEAPGDTSVPTLNKAQGLMQGQK